jgi:hypothetical protein
VSILGGFVHGSWMMLHGFSKTIVPRGLCCLIADASEMATRVTGISLRPEDSPRPAEARKDRGH